MTSIYDLNERCIQGLPDERRADQIRRLRWCDLHNLLLLKDNASAPVPSQDGGKECGRQKGVFTQTGWELSPKRQTLEVPGSTGPRGSRARTHPSPENRRLFCPGSVDALQLPRTGIILTKFVLKCKCKLKKTKHIITAANARCFC